MTIHIGILTGLLLVTALAAWFGVVIMIPRVMVSRYRYEMWRLRDAIVLELARGKVEPSPCMFELLDDIEGRIAHAHDVRMLQILTSMRFVRHHEAKLLSLHSAPPADAIQISAWRDELRKADVISVFTTSVLGWTLAFVIGVYAITTRMLGHPAGVRARIADEVQETTEEMAWPTRVGGRDLAAHVG